MAEETFTYSVVTPARNEADNLRRLAASMDAQTARPTTWLIVDNGSTDDTFAVARELAAERPWARAVFVEGESSPTRGGPVAQAFSAGVDQLDDTPDIVVKVDADVSFEEDYFERLLERFAADPSLGIAGGTCYELEDGEWRPRFATGNRFRGHARLPVALLPGRDPAREPARLGRDRRDARSCPRMAEHQLRRSRLLPPPDPRQARPEPLAAPLRGRPRRALHRLPPYVSPAPEPLQGTQGAGSARTRRRLRHGRGPARATLRGREGACVPSPEQSLRQVPARAREALGRRA